MKRTGLSFIAALLCTGSLLSQIPANPIGINPPSLKWRQIRTDRVQVVFPTGLDSAARRVANVVHYLWDNNQASVGDLKLPVTILLQNQSVISNGFVTPGPFRSEFYTTSPQFNEPTDWLDLLAIHEYRHVQQFANTVQGISGGVRTVLGSWPWGGMFGLALPRWYFEGDATGMETALTRTGRGRLPAFNMEYRSLILNDIDYGYEKAAAGSLRDFVPNWYHLGYFMTTYGRRHYGRDIWAGVLEDAVRFRGLFFPFSRSLERRSGLTTSELYEATYRELDSLWSPRLAERTREKIRGRLVNRQPKHTVTHYTNPHFLSDGRVAAEKQGYDRIPVYVAIDSAGREEKLTAPGFLFGLPESTLSVQDQQLVWAELDFDLRWANRTFSIIRTYDIVSGEKRRITSDTRLFSPALSHDGRRIAAVEATPDLRYRLVILDAHSGEVLRRLPNADGSFLAYPRWTDGDEGLVVVASRDEAARLLLLDPDGEPARELTPPTQHQLSHPYPQGEYIFFSAAWSGINNVYAVRIVDRAVFQLTGVLTGAFQPSVSADGRRLLYSEFSPQGYDVKVLDLEQTGWQPVDPPSIPFGIGYFEPLVEQEGGGSIVGKVPDREFEVKKFSKWSGIINPHSLLPYIDHPTYGLQLLSDNKFSTLSASAGGFYNVNEQEWSFLADLSYAELFPVLNGRYQLSNRSGLFVHFAPLDDTTLVQTVYSERWAENTFGGGVAVPLNLSSGNAISRLNLRADYNYLTINTQNRFETSPTRRDTIRGIDLSGFDQYYRAPISDGHLNTLDLSLSFSRYRRLARQHLNPRLGLVAGLRYRTSFASGDLEADNLLARADLYLPGAARTHSFFIIFMYQQQGLLDNYRFSDVFVYPRGYSGQTGDRYYKLGLNYALPLAYPDWALGPVAFLKRIKANAFFDFGRVELGAPFNTARSINSTGLELTFDFRAFRLLEVNAGLRYSYLLNPEFGSNGSAHQFDFLLISISE